MCRQVWDQYFVHKDAQISFLEVDGACAEKYRASVNRGTIYVGSQEEPAVLQNIVDRNPDGFNIIVDDGGHTMKQQQDTFKALWPILRPGGLYVIEDLETSYIQNLPSQRPQYQSAGYDRTTNFLKSFLDTLNCSRANVTCMNVSRMECAAEICLIQKKM